MSDNVIQTSFSVGELSPNLLARVDFAKYRSGASRMRNFFVDYRSGASTRSGTEFIRTSVQRSNKVRLVRFQQSTSVTFVLEFGAGYIAPISQGSSIVNPAIAISAITSVGGQTRITTPSFGGWLNGHLIFINAPSGPPQINGRYFYVNNTSGSAFDILDQTTGAPINSSTWPAYSGGATVQLLYLIPSPYVEADLPLLKFSQNGSVMNITHPNHPPYVLRLFSATNWTLTPAVFGATVAGPTTVLVTPTPAGTVQYKYTVTAVDANNQEGPPGPVTVNGAATDLRTTAGTNLIQWDGVPGAFAYNIYGSSASYQPLSADTGGLGFVGSVPSSVLAFYDSNIAADFSQTPPIHENPFAGVNPQVSSYFQQRLIYANGGGNLVQTFWASKVGAPYNFDVSNPTQDNDSITAALVSLEVNEIKSMIPMPSGLVVLTTKGAWQISGGAGGVATQGGPLTPATATATPQAYVGANDVPPILINYDIIFVQAKGSIVRDLTYNIYANIYTGSDISILSSHLFYGHQILEWAYAEEPFKIVWCVREDGTLLSLTTVKEQEMSGWARHDTLGNFESVCTVTEGQTDAVYVAVRRPSPTIPGTSVVCIERMADRVFTFGAEDAWAVDCGLKTVANTPPFILNTFRTADPTVFAMTCPAAIFSAGHIGWVVRASGGIYKVTGVPNASQLACVVIQQPTDVLPNDPQHRVDISQPGTWSIDPPITKVYGLNHLEGQQVAVLADGGVVNGLVVTDGTITLPSPATKVLVGYGFQAQLQTMPLDVGNEAGTIQGKRKKVAALTVRCKDSRGVKAGNTFETVTPIKELNRVTQMGLPVKLVTGDERIVMDPLWNVEGQIALQVDDPLPATILGVIPEVVVGDTAK